MVCDVFFDVFLSLDCEAAHLHWSKWIQVVSLVVCTPGSHQMFRHPVSLCVHVS